MKCIRSRTTRGLLAACASLVLWGCGGDSGSTAPATLLLPPPSTPSSDVPPTLLTSEQYPDITCEEVMVPMRDGVKLTTQIYRPQGETGKLPVVLTRNPYERLLDGGRCFAGVALGSLSLVPYGYAVVSQSVRGTFTSEGKFGLMTQESDDGYDAVEWAGTQPWSTGKVGMTGASYLGLTQWQTAIKSPPHLAAIAPTITGSDYHDNWTYVNGVFSPWFNISWLTVSFGPDQIIRAGQAAGTPQAEIDAQVSAWTSTLDSTALSAATLPLTDIPQFRARHPYFYDWLAHPDYDDYWEKMDVEANYANVKVPALVTGASYDLFNVGSVRNYQGMRAGAGTTAARNGSKFVWMAYGHSPDTKTPSFGSDAQPDALIEKRFFDLHLKGLDSGADKEPNARIYVMVPPDSGATGSGFWVSGDDFPLPGSQQVKYFMSSNGSANTRSGNGFLTTDASKLGMADRDRFVYDPANPVPTVGGNLCCNPEADPGGAREQATVEARQDVLVYTSAPLDADLPVVGMVKASFWAMTSAKDTDFTVKLVDVRPDGQTHNIVDRIVRSRYRAGSKLKPSLIDPNVPYQFDLEVGNTAMVLPKGHRIRVQVSSSNFPLYGKNLNTGADNNTTSDFVVANQTLLHGPTQLSFIELPVAPISRPK